MHLRRYVLCAAALLALPAALFAQSREAPPLPAGKDGLPLRSIILDGSAVLSAGDLQMNVTNFGFLGSMPSSQYPMSDYPSAQWPAGSGVEYLYAAGLWVGARLDGVESVSTGFPQMEFYPGSGPVDKIYRAYETIPGGNHYPARADDDGDGLVDEDWLNGRDDDGDGLVDEDFAAFGKLMYSCWFRDDEPTAQLVWPEHTPLHLGVRQETYQWGDEAYKDFIVVHYEITNLGNRFLTEVYPAIYADLDAGPRDRGNYHQDDFIGIWSGSRCAPTGGTEWAVDFSIVYVYDNDGDGGRTPGYFGVMLLGCTQRIFVEQTMTMDGRKYYIPVMWGPSVHGIRIFAGLLPYIHGGEPVNDLERYGSLSKSGWDPEPVVMNDYKVLLSVGPFGVVAPDSTITVDFAYVAGNGLEDMLDNAAAAALMYRGVWVDADHNVKTGVSGLESVLTGPLKGFVPDPCAWDEQTFLQVLPGESIWVNADCYDESYEYSRRNQCRLPSNNPNDYKTGINGKETHVRFVTSSSSVPPNMRVVAGDDKVIVHWDNRSELIPDPMSLKNDFEGYEIWRADDWHRPIGTSESTGPSSDLWSLLDSGDLVNGVSPDNDFKQPEKYGGFKYEPLAQIEHRDAFIRSFEQIIKYDPLGPIPCPPGLTDEECDTVEALARWNLGYEGGRQYYQYVDRDVKNGMPYFYSVVAYDHTFDAKGRPYRVGEHDYPYSNFRYVVPQSSTQNANAFREEDVYVVPNPVTAASMAAWTLGPMNADPSGEKLEFRNLPRCRSTVRIYTVAGDLVQTLSHDGTNGVGTLPWNLVSRKGQSITSGIYLYSVEPSDRRFRRIIGKFVVIR
jgi:hypothetical protein